MSPEDTMYDPTEIQLQEAMKAATADGPVDLASLPSETARIWIWHLSLQNRNLLMQAKALENEVSKGRVQVSDLDKRREDFRVRLAKSNVFVKASVIEIPLSLLMGFAVNFITQGKPQDNLVWIVVAIACLLSLLYLRISGIETGA